MKRRCRSCSPSCSGSPSWSCCSPSGHRRPDQGDRAQPALGRRRLRRARARVPAPLGRADPPLQVERRDHLLAAALPVRDPLRPLDGLPRFHPQPGARGRRRRHAHRRAVRYGITVTAGVVTSAALVMVGVFSLFGSLSTLELKQAGVGLAAAVLLDATVVRAVLLPASMTLLGEWNWYLPKWLEWGSVEARAGLSGRRDAALRDFSWRGGAVPHRPRVLRGPRRRDRDRPRRRPSRRRGATSPGGTASRAGTSSLARVAALRRRERRRRSCSRTARSRTATRRGSRSCSTRTRSSSRRAARTATTCSGWPAALALVRLLLERGADPNRGNDYGWTQLHQAGYSNRRELRAAAARRGRAHRPLGARRRRHAARRGALLGPPRGRRPARPRAGQPARRGRARRCRRWSASSPGRPRPARTARFYRPHGGFPAWQPSDDPQEVLDEALVWAAKADRVEALRLLVELGARVDADPYRGTALTWAAANGRVEAIRALVELGADPNRRGTFGGPDHGEGVTALHLAAQAGPARGGARAARARRRPDRPRRAARRHARRLGRARRARGLAGDTRRLPVELEQRLVERDDASATRAASSRAGGCCATRRDRDDAAAVHVQVVPEDDAARPRASRPACPPARPRAPSSRARSDPAACGRCTSTRRARRGPARRRRDLRRTRPSRHHGRQLHRSPPKASRSSRPRRETRPGGR